MNRNSAARGVGGIYSFQKTGHDQADDAEQLAEAMWVVSEMEGSIPRGYIYLPRFRFNPLLLKTQRKSVMSPLIFSMSLHHRRFSILNINKSRYPQQHTLSSPPPEHFIKE